MCKKKLFYVTLVGKIEVNMSKFERLSIRINVVREVLQSTHSPWAQAYWSQVEQQLMRKWKQITTEKTYESF